MYIRHTLNWVFLMLICMYVLKHENYLDIYKHSHKCVCTYSFERAREREREREVKRQSRREIYDEVKKTKV